jgi:hypothetical protein
MHQEEGFKFCFDTRNNKAFPLDPAYHDGLNVQSMQVYLLRTKNHKQQTTYIFTNIHACANFHMINIHKHEQYV